MGSPIADARFQSVWSRRNDPVHLPTAAERAAAEERKLVDRQEAALRTSLRSQFAVDDPVTTMDGRHGTISFITKNGCATVLFKKGKPESHSLTVLTKR
ncbi:MAG: hypothetical protein ABA06_01465 [Parcubacteria bacterium C7867-001]|nr:MAG: hypothetical protein ABA06_01465 [Parcubacteria bacterium C7867-001]